MPGLEEEALDIIDTMSVQYIISLHNVNLDVSPPQYGDPVSNIHDLLLFLDEAGNMVEDCKFLARFGLDEGLGRLIFTLIKVMSRSVMVSDAIQGFIEDLKRKEPYKARILEKYDEMLNRVKISLLVDIENKLGECLCKYAGRRGR